MNHRGEVFIYSVLHSGSDALLLTEFSHQMVIAKPGETPAKASSPTSSMAWSSDGYALVAGWDVGGLALWSTYGHLLFSTFSDESGFLSRYFTPFVSFFRINWSYNDLQSSEGKLGWFLPRYKGYCTSAQVFDVKSHYWLRLQMWGPGNYDLFLLPSARYAQEVVSDIYVVQFAKSSLATLINSVWFFRLW